MMLTTESTHAVAPITIHDFAGKPAQSHKRETSLSAEQPKDKRISEDRVEETVRDLNDQLQSINAEVSFSVDKETHKIVLRIVNGKTGELIRQIPAEETLRISSHLNKLLGLLIDGNA